MKKITPFIERYISNSNYDNSDTSFVKYIVTTNSVFDEIKEQVNKKLDNVTRKEASSLCLDCAMNARILRMMLPKGSIDEMFNNLKNYQETIEEFEFRLLGVFNLADWQVDIFNINHKDNSSKDSIFLTNKNIYTVIFPQLNDNIPYLISFMKKNGYCHIKSFLSEDIKPLEDVDSKMIPMSAILFVRDKHCE